jgi:serine/threonine protein kinase
MAAAIKDDFVPRFQTYVTQPYRPPELWNCSGPIAKFLAVGVDLWSFGCVVFEVATGFSLMAGRT